MVVNKMLFFKLINSSFRRNGKAYGPYLLATSMLVAINYIFAAIGVNHSPHRLASSSATTAMINISANFILMVTFAFLLYVNRFLWQQRSSELGLYSMLGMTSRNLDILTVIEKVYLFIGSIVCGLVTGVIFERLAFLGLGRLLKVHNLKQPWIEPAALGKTILYMGGFFVILMVVDLVKLHRLNPNQLWHATAPAPKRHGWLFKLLGLLGIVLLAGAYYITLTTKPQISAFSNFMTAVLLVVAGTYLLFIAGSVIILQFLQRQKKFYYRPRHFIAISGMLQRMEQNGASLATICLLCSAVLVALFSSITLYAGIGDTVKLYAPKDVVMITNQPVTRRQQGVIESVAKNHHAKITSQTSYQATTTQNGYWRGQHFINQGSLEHMTNKTTNSVIFVSSHDYRKITGKPAHLRDNQALIYSPAKQHTGQVTIAGHRYQAKNLSQLSFAFNPEHSIYAPAFVIVNHLPAGLPKMNVTGFNYRLKGSDRQHIRFENDLQAHLQLANMQLTGRYNIHYLFNSLYGGMVFAGIMISLALGITTTIVIYFKQISEGYADQYRFKTMQQVGLSKRETTKSIHSQVLMVFMLPIAGAVINLLFAIPAIKQIMTQLSFYNLQLMITVAVAITAALMVIYLLIYGLTTRVYHQIVDNIH